MKIRSLLLGSITAAGLSTGAYAADPMTEVFTALDLCDALGLTGIVVSSDTNCLQISGEVTYEFNWGDYRGSEVVVPLAGGFGPADIMAPDGVAGTEMDWESQVEATLTITGTADTDVGPAKGVIVLNAVDEVRVQNEAVIADDDDTDGVVLDEAYVAIGGSTVLMAGKKGSIRNNGDDESFLAGINLFLEDAVDAGVYWTDGLIPVGDASIQIVSDLGNGLSIGAGLENLDDTTTAAAGTGVLVATYAGEGLTAHVSLVAGGILDGTVENFGVHAGFTGTFENFRIRAAIAADNQDYWNALATAEATFDIFKIAIAGEAAGEGGLTDYGWGGSISATVVDGVTLNLAGRYYSDAASGIDGYHIMGQIVAAVTETLKLTGEVGYYANNAAVALSDVYGKVTLDWAPGGGFTSSISGEVHENGAYKATFKAGKVIE